MSAAGAHAAEAPRFIRVPVLFVTDRERKKEDVFGPNRKYVVDCKHDPFYGVLYYNVPNVEGKELSERLVRLGWQPAGRKSAKVCQKEIIEPADPVSAKSKFREKITSFCRQSAADGIYLFAHGMNNKFEDAAMKAATLAYYLEAPTLLYSWPSVGSLFSYHVDEGNIEWSFEHFRQLLVDLEDVLAEGKARLSIVAHSLSNRLVIWAAEDLIASKAANEVVLVCPDIDTETFKHYGLRYNNSPVNIKLYISGKDRALSLSQMFYGGYYRLGEGVDSFFTMMSRPDEIVDSAREFFEDAFGKDAGKKAEKEGESKDDTEAAAGSSNGGIRTIDFTDVDRGIIGHKIPYSLIGHMCREGKPGPGLTLKVEPARSPNMMSRFMRWSYDLFAPPVGERGLVERVRRIE